jgi:hypothetical protein
MSKGPGYIQRSILALVEKEPHGAWTTSDLCRAAYGKRITVSKAHRVAVLRALTRMTLPGTFEVWKLPDVTEYCLCDPCDDESQMRRYWLASTRGSGWRARHDDGQSFADWRESPYEESARAEALKAAAKSRRWRDATPIERINIQIERQQTRLRLISPFITTNDVHALTEHIAALKAERDKLMAAEEGALM